MTKRQEAGWIRPALLAAAILLYGALSSPTPDMPGRREALIGLLMVLAVGFRQPLFAITAARALDRGAPALERNGAIAFALLFWIPLLRGLALGSEPSAIIRDLVPLLYLFTPVLLGGLLMQAEFVQRLTAVSLALAGVLFSLRFFEISGLDATDIGRLTGTDRLLYLANSPSVLFAAIGLALFAFRKDAFVSPMALALSAVAAVGSLICLGALAGTLQRGPLLLAAAALFGFYAWRARYSAMALLAGPLVLAVAGFVLYEPALGTWALMEEKTALVGVNARQDEFAAVLDQIGRDPLSLLFGDGWGALVSSPAVGGLRVGYTHTFLSYLLLKSGLFGVLVAAAYFLPVLAAVVTALRSHPTLAIALLPPLALGATITTSFKFLDFGLLLALLCATGARDASRSGNANARLLRSESAC